MMKDAKTSKAKDKETSFYREGSILYELVGDKTKQYFVRFDPIGNISTVVDFIEGLDNVYIPPQNDLVNSGIISLAEYPQEYGRVIDLFEAIKHFIHKYVDIPDQFLIISTLYVMLTWLYDCFDVIPYLRVVGEFGTGKSRFLFVVGSVAYKACFAGGATSTSPIFRINEIYQGVTLVFDEADFSYSGADADIVKILNCGYMKGMPVLRTEGDGNNRVPKGFNVYGPKIIATRNQFQDAALESRCLTQVMAGRPRADIPRHLPKTFKKEATDLKNKLLMFRLKNYSSIEIDPSLEIEGLEPRINQVAMPILSIIQDEAVRNEVRQALTSLQKNLNDLKQDQEPALILRALLEMVKGSERQLGYIEVAKKINELVGIDSDFHYAVSPSKIGRINKAALALETHQVAGVNRFKTSVSNLNMIVSLGKRYGLDNVDDVDLVELYYGSQDQVSDNKLLEEAQEALL